jgi:hypothetical protein
MADIKRENGPVGLTEEIYKIVFRGLYQPPKRGYTIQLTQVKLL